MNVVTGRPGAGKTRAILQQCAREGGYIVCLNKDECHRVQTEAIKDGFDIPLPITFSDFLCRKYYGPGIGKFHIDNADLLLQSLTSVKIDSISVTT